MLKEHTAAPNFNLISDTNESVCLYELKDNFILIYFYPKDDTPGCTKEACMIRDVYNEFAKLGIKVLGISSDSPKSHADFKEKYELPFTLLSDPDKKVIEQYEAKQLVSIKRISYLLNNKKEIIKTYKNVDPASHAGEILSDVHDIISKYANV